MKKVNNKDASIEVATREEFTGPNTYGIHKGENIYAAYSYGDHFPMYVYNNQNGVWYENSCKYSCTTSKQQTQLRPTLDTVKRTTEELQKIIRNDGE